MKKAIPRATWIPLLLAFLAFGFSQAFLFGMSATKVRQTQTLSHLKWIGLEMQIFAEAHGGTLPPLQSREALLRALPKIEPSEAESTGWKVPFATNPEAPETIGDAERVVVYEAKAFRFGDHRVRGVLFADGHAKMIDESRWPEIRRQNRIDALPEPSVARWWEIGKSGPKEPLPRELFGNALGFVALSWVAVGAWLRARLCPKPIAEFFVALLSYSVVTYLLATILLSAFLTVRIR